MLRNLVSFPRLRSHYAISAFLISILALTACSFVQPATDSPAQSPAASTQAAVAPTSEAAPTQVMTLSTPAPTSAPTETQPAPASPTQAPAPLSTLAPSPVMDSADREPNAIELTLGPDREELTTVDVVKILTPSIVQVTTESLSMGLFNQAVPSSGLGTGVILDTDGHILTNNHVVAGAQSITVTLPDGEGFVATVVGNDFQTDLAVIRIDPGDYELNPAKLGHSSKLQVGEDVIAIGHALGLPGGPTVSKGVVSALGRTIDTDAQNTIVDLIQTDAEINPGNSGGALVNNSAEVIGINTAIIQAGRGIGFAINIDDAKIVVRQLMDKGFVERGFIGISPVNVTAGLAERFGFPVKEGLLIGRVILGTAAAEAGLQVEDIIVQLDETTIKNSGDLSKFLIANQPGETVDVVFFRGDRQMMTQITLRGRPQG